MRPESAEGRLRQPPPRRVTGMDMHAYGPGQRGADSTCARDHRALCVSVPRPACGPLI